MSPPHVTRLIARALVAGAIALPGIPASGALVQVGPTIDSPGGMLLVLPPDAIAPVAIDMEPAAEIPEAVAHPAPAGRRASAPVPRSVRIPLNRARLLLSNGDHESALEAANEALNAGPANPTALILRGAAEAGLGRYEAALNTYDTLLKIEPGAAAARHSRGLALQGLGRTSEAEDEFSRTIRIDPTFAEAHLKRGLIRARDARLEDALADFSRYIDLRPDDALGYQNRAVALVKLGRQADAAPDIQRARRLRAANPR
ncbi:hypothetical protein BH23VER1_BH23VER1_30100 [soil metagenome]